MRRTSVRMPVVLLEEIEDLVELGLFDHRSEAIRFMVRQWFADRGYPRSFQPASELGEIDAQRCGSCGCVVPMQAGGAVDV